MFYHLQKIYRGSYLLPCFMFIVLSLDIHSETLSKVEVQKLQKKLKQKETLLQKRAVELEGKNQKINELSKWKIEKRQKISNLESNKVLLTKSIQELKQKIKTCEGRLNGSSHEIGNLVQETELQQGQISSAKKELGDLKKHHSNCLNKMSLLKKQFKRLEREYERTISKRSGRDSGIKRKLTAKLQKRISGINKSVWVDNSSGNIVIQFGKSFGYKPNSHNLKKNSYKLLLKVIPALAEILFSDETLRLSLKSVNFAVHGSPQYGGKFIPLNPHNNLAYAYNMRLSAQRAVTITNFIFGRRMIDYPYKNELRAISRATGESYSHPVRAVRKTKNCGEYDCIKSQRLEIEVEFKG